MKKFLTEISIAIVMISIGCIVCVFEFKDFRFINDYADVVENNYQTYDTTVDKENSLRIELDDEFVKVDFDIDDSLEDEVRIEVSENIKHKFSKNKLRISDDSWHSISFGAYLDAWLDGLKDKKIYYFSHDSSGMNDYVVIHCSSDAKRYIEIKE